MNNENLYSFKIPTPPKIWIGKVCKNYIIKFFERNIIIGSPGSGKEVNVYDTLFENYGRKKALEIIKEANLVFEPKSKQSIVFIYEYQL